MITQDFWRTMYDTGMTLGQYQPSELQNPFPPYFHKAGRAAVLISLTADGELISVDMPKEGQEIFYPVTIDSVTRSGLNAAKMPHPLCDTIKHLDTYYRDLISDWYAQCQSPILAGIINFLYKEDYMEQILAHIQKGNPASLMVAWIVDGVNCWDQLDLFQAWINYYEPKYREGKELELCMITGEKDVRQEKGVNALIPHHALGKMISSNNTQDFVFIGRFLNANQAMCVGVRGAHFAQQAIKWLATFAGINIGQNEYLCVWSPNRPKDAAATVGSLLNEPPEPVRPFEYDRQTLRRSVFGSGEGFLDDSDVIVTALFGGLTQGRISLNFFQIDSCSQYLLRLETWARGCAWEFWDKAEKRYRPYSPSLLTIANWAFGVQNQSRTRISIVQESLKNTLVSRLARAKLNGDPIPEEFVRALVSRMEMREVYGSWLTPVAMSVLRKYYIDRHGEFYGPDLDAEKMDRSYLYGRLLAIYQKYESEYLDVIGDPRTTQAMRRQREFAQYPERVSGVLQDRAEKAWSGKLKPYRVAYFNRLIAEIREKIEALPAPEKSKLEWAYLFGYVAQTKDFYNKKEK